MQEIYNGTNPGVVIAHSTNTNTTPVATPAFLVSYEVREYTLPVPVTKEWRFPDVAGNDLELGLVTFQKMWILTVRGGPFYVGNNSYYIWLDDRLLDAAGNGLDAVSVFVYDPQQFIEGAEIRVTWGLYPPTENNSPLPERLHFNKPPTP